MNRAIFRPRIGPLLSSAAMWLALAYALLLGLAPDPSVFADYPFGWAAGAAGVRLFWLYWGKYRKRAIVVDDTALRCAAVGFDVPWTAVEELRIELTEIGEAPMTRIVPVVTVVGRQTSLSFADLGTHNRANLPILNLPSAPLLLAIIVGRTQAEPIYPLSWTNQTPAEPAPSGVLPAQSEVHQGSFVQRFAGIITLGVKLLPKIATTAIKLVSIIKPGAALLTIGVYSAVFSWRFALAFILMVGVHECGHVFAMWRCNIPVKGIYFIPFFGGVAVGQARASRAAQEAFIAINGPVWGTLLSVTLLVVDRVVQVETPILQVLAVWGALMNLFNLLPVNPLDGGQVLSALVGTRSFAPKVVGVSLLCGAVIAYLTGLDLLVLAVGVGLWEWTRLLALADESAGFRLLNARPIDPLVLEHFYIQCTVLEPAQYVASQREARGQVFSRLCQDSTRAAMRPQQAFAVVAGYVALVATLLGILFTVGTSVNLGQPSDLLR